QIVYATITGASTDLRILTLSTGAVTDLQISGWAPSWAPAGNRIAYLQGSSCQSTLAVMNADGSNPHALTTDAYQGEVDWSPDGQWIVAQNVSRNRLDLINASSGVIIPLPNTAGMSSPSWLASPPSMQRIREIMRGRR
ncbi:MAG TPA: hypothetical protein VFA43_15830, partial [Gemmatimonadaceae bacterium]|nr:hypothetical protein [Gemmatimonadaceae bacterium]